MMKSISKKQKTPRAGQAEKTRPARLEGDIRESEIRYRRLFESAQDGILIVNATTGLVNDANPYLLDLLGYAREEIVKKKVWQLYADVKAAKKAFETLQKKTYLRMDDLPMQGKDGQLTHVECVSNVYQVGKNTVIQFNIRDIAEKISADEALKANERRFRSLIENSQDAIALLDATGKLIYESPSGLRITGYSKEERIGGSGFDLIPPDDLGNVRQNFGRVVQTSGAAARLQVRSRRKDGEWRWVDVTVVNLLADPAVGAIVINYRDITERRQAETALAEAQQAQRLLLESVGEGIHGLDLEGRIMFENAASLQMFGWEADEMLGENAHTLIHHHHADGSLYPVDECPIHRTLHDGEMRRVENEVFFRRDGRSFPIEYTCAAMKDKDGAITGVVVSFRDVTEHRQAEEKLRQSENIYRSIAHNMPHGTVALFDKELRFVVADGSAIGIAGPPRELVEGRTIWEAFPPEVSQMIEPFYRDALAGKETTLEVPFGDFIFESHNVPVKDEKGDVFAGLVVAHDITERKQAEENIQRERVFSDAIINGMPGIFYLFNEEGKFLRWNENFEKVSGYSAAEIAALHPTDLFEGAEKELIRQRIEQVFETGYAFAEADFLSRDGERTPHYLTGVRVELNGQTCLLGVGVDITERKRAEKALTDLSRAVNASGDIVFMTDKDGMITSVNSQFSDLYGYSPDEVVGKTTPRILKSGKQGPEVYQRFWQKIRRGELFRGEMFNKAKDGRLIPIEETVNPFFDERGEIAGFLAIQRNITDRRRAEESLRLAEAKYRALVENIPAVVYMDEADETSANVYTSPYTEKMLGYPASAHVEDPTLWQKTVDPRDYSRVVEAIRRTLAEGSAVEEYRFIASDGRTVWVRDLAVLLRAEDGRPQFIQGFIEDITTQKQAEEKIKAHAAELEKEISERKRTEQALVKSERDYRYLFNTAGDAILIFEPQGETILQANATACRLYGFEYQEIVGRSLKELTTNAGRGEAYVNAFVKGEASNIFESTHINKNGGEIEVLINSSLIEFEGKPAILALVRDVTDRKRAEMALKKSEARLSEAQRIAHLGNWEWNIPANSIWWSDEIYRIFGLGPREFDTTFEGFLNAVHPDDRARVADAISKAFQGETPYDIDHRILLPDGTEKFLHEQAVVERDESGAPARMIGISHDITERKRAEENIQKQLGRLKALREIDWAVSSGFDMQSNLRTLLRHATVELGVNAASILLLNPNLNWLEHSASYGFRTRSIEKSILMAGEGFAGQVVKQRGLVRVDDLYANPSQFPRASLLVREGFICYFGVPLIAKGVVKGVLEVFHRSPLDPDQEWLDFLHTLAGQAAIAVEDAQLFNNLQQFNFELLHAYDATIEGWSRALDLRDKETEGHTQRVTDMAIRLAQRFGLSDEELKYIRWGGLLHDIGKMGVPDNILLKAGALTNEEVQIMRKHPVFAYEMLSPIRYLKSGAIDIPYSHHEKWNGTGYPRGLKGEQIPLPARIFAVADVFDAVTSDRPYRSKWEIAKAISHIREQSGSHFDPSVVETFLQMIGDELEQPNEK